ncbi:hypothetical protein BU16DRAFT_564209 [Lophium mytilinum]|uniref:Uncharacterized protein n=1 Tax=Lophium mytilinum TaxID=390894 RepID=A0A6A6QLH7_9PEZI|nr:hypothetical protein BU16DRAFT_564209 [Lophium mytilinum]
MLTKTFIVALLSYIVIAVPVSFAEERSQCARNEGQVLTKPFETYSEFAATGKRDEVESGGQWKREHLEGDHIEALPFHVDTSLSQHNKVEGGGQWKRQEEVEGGGDWKRDEFEEGGQQ